MKNEMIFAYMIQLSTHMWDDENSPPRGWYLPKKYTENNKIDVNTWDETVRFLAESKYNLLLIDVGDGIKYELHPEISAPNAWDKDFMKKKLDEIRALGMTPIPKLNFSCGHNTWLKQYRRMVSTPIYYKVCSDLIKEVCEVFGNPEYIHLGMDEENPQNQRYREAIHVRQGDLWWHDVYFYFKEAEKNGARPWIWADYCWDHADEFVNKMPKSVLQSNWYYYMFDDFPKDNPNKTAIDTYELLDKHGFEQIPTCSCWHYHGATNPFQTLAYGKDKLTPDLLKGYMIAPWFYTIPDSVHRLKHDAHMLYAARRDLYPETIK